MGGFEPSILVLACAAFVVGGIVKGAIGIGLPAIAIAILSGVLPVPLTLALVAIPILTTNLWQAVHTGNPLEPLRRFWPMVVCLVLFIWLSAGLVVALDPRVMNGVLGGVLILFTITDRFRTDWRIPPSAERWAAPLAGTLGGILGGISTIWGPPMLMYLVTLRLPKDMYIRAVGLIWFAGSLPLVAAYVRYGILTVETGTLSVLACVPSFLGMAVGQWLRDRINQSTFRIVLLIFLFITGLNLLRRALF